MALDFPASPTLNQVYTSGNKSWIWNGTGWAANNTIGTTLTVAGVQQIINKTFISPQEVWTISATSATGTVNYDITTQGILYYTTAASANFTLNFRGSSSVTLKSWLPVGQSVNVIFVNTTTTAYAPTTFTIDGGTANAVTVTPKWQNGVIPTGNSNSIDMYSFEIVKTVEGTTPTYQVFANTVRYA